MEVELGVRKRRVRVQPIRVPIDNFDDTEKEHLTFHYAFTPCKFINIFTSKYVSHGATLHTI